MGPESLFLGCVEAVFCLLPRLIRREVEYALSMQCYRKW